jgi:hypothetical protein
MSPPAEKVVCRGCGKPLTGTETVCDGCDCNSPRGINHGLVPTHVCVCPVCDPDNTGAPRPPPKVKFREFF